MTESKNPRGSDPDLCHWPGPDLHAHWFRALPGPLLGYRRDTTVPIPVRIYELTPGGCLVQFYDPTHRERRIQLEIALPRNGWISVDTEVLDIRRRDGYVACFMNLPRETEARIERALQRMEREHSDSGETLWP